MQSTRPDAVGGRTPRRRAARRALALFALAGALFAAAAAPAAATAARSAVKPAPVPPAGVAVGTLTVPKPHSASHGATPDGAIPNNTVSPLIAADQQAAGISG